MATNSYPQFLLEAEERLNNLRTISEDLDLGNGITTTALAEKIDLYKSTRNSRKFHQSVVASESVTLSILEKEIRDFSERSLIGVAAKFGKDSEEYGKAGGTRKVDRKRPVRVVKVNNDDTAQ
jgi:hypothetical protein